MTDLDLHEDVVRAVLDFIDEYDSEVQLSVPSRADETVPSTPQPRRHSGQRARDEIRRLRAAVAELEAHREKLAHNVPFTDTDGDAHGTSSWKRIALSRKLERFRAQTENARLRRLVGEKQQLARKLEKKLTRPRRRPRDKPSNIPTPPLGEEDWRSTWPSEPGRLGVPAFIT